MSDLTRLRDHLYAVLLATPLLACSGSSPPTKVPEPASPDAGVVAIDATLAPDAEPVSLTPPLEEPFPTEFGSCSSGTWCGTKATAAEHGDAEKRLGCPESFAVGAVFNLDLERTKDRRHLHDLETCCYEWHHYCPGGRPYGDAAIAGDTAAARWLAAAQTEHASVASFARASLELMAVGAPPALIAACHRAALDELRHASACLAISSRLAGRALAVAPVPALAPRGGGIVRVAVDTYLEGCVAETHGALVALRALEGCTDDDASRALRRIARDEARHAELAWQIVAWAIEVGGAPVRAAIADAHLRLGAPPPARAADPALAGTGQLDDAGLDLAAHDAWREIIAPLTARVLRS